MTFSMVAWDPRPLAHGVVTCTSGRAVGSVVPHVKEGVGAIATQATTNVLHGIIGLRLLSMGFEPSKALASTLALDNEPELRQVLIIDSKGRKAAHTGSLNIDWKGHILGENYIIGGNNIVGPEVLKRMSEAFESSREELIQERLLKAIEAGLEAGGCNHPDHTAALKVVGIEEELKLSWRPILDLRVDSSEEPIKELRNLYENYREWIREARKRK